MAALSGLVCHIIVCECRAVVDSEGSQASCFSAAAVATGLNMMQRSLSSVGLVGHFERDWFATGRV